MKSIPKALKSNMVAQNRKWFTTQLQSYMPNHQKGTNGYKNASLGEKWSKSVFLTCGGEQETKKVSTLSCVCWKGLNKSENDLTFFLDRSLAQRNRFGKKYIRFDY